MPNKFTTLGSGLFAGCHPDLVVEFGNESDYELGDQDILYNKNKTMIYIYLGNYTTITIIKSVKEICGSVFIGKKELQTVIFEPESNLEQIDSYAFSRTGVTKFVFPAKLKSIFWASFEYSDNLQSVEFGTEIEYIGSFSFNGCSLLEKVIIKGTSYKIDNCAFFYCINLKTVDLGNGVTEIGSSAFQSDSEITEINIPKTLTTLGQEAFRDCTKLNKVVFEKESPLVNISTYTFKGCSLETIVFPDSVNYFGTYALANTNIKNFTVPSSLETIDAFTFNECKELVTLVIPKGSKLNYIGYAAFYGCFLFENITLESDEFKLINGALYNKEVSKLIVVPPNIHTKFFHFPETLRIIGQSALLHCVNIEQMFIPSNSVVEIQNNAFEDCLSLQNINLPECVIEIGREAFKNCPQIQCGLLIENRTSEFTENLIKKALMKPISLNTCERICSIERTINKRHFTYLLILLCISK